MCICLWFIEEVFTTRKLFDEKSGLLLLDEIICEKDSFKSIVQDGIVSDNEIMRQAEDVITLLKRIDSELNEAQKELVVDAISELAVLYQVSTLHKGE